MPDLEIDQLVGDGSEPTAEFVRALRLDLAAEYRGEDPASIERHFGRWLVAAAALVAVVAGAAWVGGGGAPREVVHPGTSAPTAAPTTAPTSPYLRVSTIVFDQPTVAWISNDGRSALSQDGGTWFLGSYDSVGLVSRFPVDHVETRPFHTVLPSGSPLRSAVIDDFSYEMVAGVWTRRGCFSCTIDRITPPTVQNGGFDPEWLVSYNGLQWRLTPPEGWDGQAPDLFEVAAGANTQVALVAHTRGGDSWSGLLSTDPHARVRTIPGRWMPVGVEADGLLARREDPARLDYSVDLIDWAPVVVDPSVPGVDRLDTGTDATPAAGGEVVAHWTGADLASKGVYLDETRSGVLPDGTLVSLSSDNASLILVGPDGAVRSTVPVPKEIAASGARLAIRDGSIAAFVTPTGETRMSLLPESLGQPEPSPSTVTVVPDGCTFAVARGGQRWVVPCGTVSEVRDAVGLADGSVLAITLSTLPGPTADTLDDVVEVAAVRLDASGAQHRVVLGRHAIDGAEGWATFQATATGGDVVFHYGDDTLVLYRYSFTS
jgi:hypothetical protein